MPIPKIVIFLGFIVGCWLFTKDVEGQSTPPAGPSVGGTGSAIARDSQQQQQGDLDRAVRELKQLSLAQLEARSKPQSTAGEAKEVDRLKSQLELQQKQIDVLLRMTQLLADQVKKPPAAAATVEKLEDQTATLEAGMRQGAQRDLEQAQAHDMLVEQFDKQSHPEPELPAPLRELFNPTRNNESPLAIYGILSDEFNTFSKQNSTFRPPTLQLHPYLLLNEKWLMSANIIFLSSSITVCRMQAERFINDNLTFVAGRSYSPIGFFSERLRLNWVIKTPDNPLMFNQVYPDNLYFDGLQLRGAKYLLDTPVKMEYVGFVANGLSVAGSKLSPRTYSDLSNFTDSINDVNSAKAYGGRLGLSIPEHGFIAGLSGLLNQAYDSANHDLTLWDVDVNWHKGNWDARFELAKMNQQTPAPAPSIQRFGYYAQIAYRQYNNPNPFLQKLEGVFRYDHVQFNGINLAQTGIGFGGYEPLYARMPLDRNRYTLGLNYWFYSSLALKLAMEWYEELGIPSLRDDGFIGQLVWGF